MLTRISVEYTGPGIEAEAVSRLFTAFTQARPRTDHAGGAGLGLAISKQFVDLMEGKLDLESTVGKGTTTSSSCCPVRVDSTARALTSEEQLRGG